MGSAVSSILKRPLKQNTCKNQESHPTCREVAHHNIISVVSLRVGDLDAFGLTQSLRRRKKWPILVRAHNTKLRYNAEVFGFALALVDA